MRSHPLCAISLQLSFASCAPEFGRSSAYLCNIPWLWAMIMITCRVYAGKTGMVSETQSETRFAQLISCQNSALLSDNRVINLCATSMQCFVGPSGLNTRTTKTTGDK